MKRNLGILVDGLGKTLPENVALAKKAGFTNVFTNYYDLKTVCELQKLCAGAGLVIDFIHAPFAGINEMWKSGDGYKKIFNGMKESISTAKKTGVPVVVLHVSSSFFPPDVSPLGLRRFDKIVDYAEKLGVKVAFENLRRLGHLAVIMDRYEQKPHVGFCYDIGHANCYALGAKEAFGKKTLCTHIHDNHGRSITDPYSDGDEHLLPFDGTIDYERVMRFIDSINYTGTLTLEVAKSPKYENLSAEEFTISAFERIKKISEL